MATAQRAPCHAQSEREGVKGENWAALVGGSLDQNLRLAVLKARICVITELALSTGEIRSTAELDIRWDGHVSSLVDEQVG
jgi:hypothetical protein